MKRRRSPLRIIALIRHNYHVRYSSLRKKKLQQFSKSKHHHVSKAPPLPVHPAEKLMRAIRKREKKNKDGKCEADRIPTDRTEPLTEPCHRERRSSRSTTRDTILHFTEKQLYSSCHPNWRMGGGLKRGHFRSSALKSHEKTSLFTIREPGKLFTQQ